MDIKNLLEKIEAEIKAADSKLEKADGKDINFLFSRIRKLKYAREIIWELTKK